MKKIIMSSILALSIMSAPILQVNAAEERHELKAEIKESTTETTSTSTSTTESSSGGTSSTSDKGKNETYIPTGITKNPMITTVGASMLAFVIGFLFGNKKEKGDK